MNGRTTEHRQPTHYTLVGLSLVVLAIMSLSGCATYERRDEGIDYNGGYHSPRVTDYYEYYYYPEQHVYYDIHRHVYHYNDQDRGWLVVNRLPSRIHLSQHHEKTLKYRHNLPWSEAHERKRHRAHRDVIKRDRAHVKKLAHIEPKRDRAHVKKSVHIEPKRDRAHVKKLAHIEPKRDRAHVKKPTHIKPQRDRENAQGSNAQPVENYGRRHDINRKDRPRQSKQNDSKSGGTTRYTP